MINKLTTYILLTFAVILFVIVTVFSIVPRVHAESLPFLVNLRLGDTHNDVQRLQQYLNMNNFAVASSGAGSVGQETTFFGSKTRAALMRLQEQYATEILSPVGLTQATGNFFSSTRQFVNGTLNSSSSTISLITTNDATRRRSGPRHTQTRYVVTPSGDGNVVITPSAPQNVYEGNTTSFTVTPDVGYVVSEEVDGTCPVGSWVDTVYTTGEITESCTVIFSASVATYTVTPSGDGHQSVTPEVAQTVEHGSTESFEVIPESGFGQGAVTGTCPAGSWAHNIYTTGAITESCSVVFSGVDSDLAGGAMTLNQDGGTIYMRQYNGATEYSFDQIEWNIGGWPMTITNLGESVLTIQFVSDFTVFSANTYFIVGSPNIKFQGQTDADVSPTIFTIAQVTNYPGLIQNGTLGVPGYNNIEISDIFVSSDASTLASDGGWITQVHFGNGATNSLVNRSGSDGSIANSSGGVLGGHNESITVSECYSTGSIGNGGGGIVGADSIGVTVHDSYSSGIIGASGGGIVGINAVSPVAYNVYTTGNIGTLAGGIIGRFSSGASVTNAYSLGNIGTSAGGIMGGLAEDSLVNNVYTVGNTNGGVGGIFGASYVNVTLLNSYAEGENAAAGWNDGNAATVLTGVGTTWISSAPNTPYTLGVFSN